MPVDNVTACQSWSYCTLSKWSFLFLGQKGATWFIYHPSNKQHFKSGTCTCYTCKVKRKYFYIYTGTCTHVMYHMYGTGIRSCMLHNWKFCFGFTFDIHFFGFVENQFCFGVLIVVTCIGEMSTSASGSLLTCTSLALRRINSASGSWLIVINGSRSS